MKSTSEKCEYLCRKPSLAEGLSFHDWNIKHYGHCLMSCCYEPTPESDTKEPREKCSCTKRQEAGKWCGGPDDYCSDRCDKLPKEPQEERCDAPKGSVCLTCAADEAECKGCAQSDGHWTFCESHGMEAAKRRLDRLFDLTASISGIPRSVLGKEPERDTNDRDVLLEMRVGKLEGQMMHSIGNERDYYTKQEIDRRLNDLENEDRKIKEKILDLLYDLPLIIPTTKVGKMLMEDRVRQIRESL